MMMMMMMMMMMTAESMDAFMEELLRLYFLFSLDIVNFGDDNFFSLEIPMQNITHN
jgi:hypothetical protein